MDASWYHAFTSQLQQSTTVDRLLRDVFLVLSTYGNIGWDEMRWDEIRLDDMGWYGYMVPDDEVDPSWVLSTHSQTRKKSLRFIYVPTYGVCIMPFLRPLQVGVVLYRLWDTGLWTTHAHHMYLYLACLCVLGTCRFLYSVLNLYWILLFVDHSLSRH